MLVHGLGEVQALLAWAPLVLGLALVDQTVPHRPAQHDDAPGLTPAGEFERGLDRIKALADALPVLP
ncbi:MAG: hypothetical protein IPJ73_20580 [Zoogloea sp.]|nr:hypothetical protein [Zoogloea sp.]